MQSGISASQELQTAFKELVSSSGNQRGLIAGIKNEQIVPLQTVESTSGDFFNDLSVLDLLLKDNEAAYVILRRHDNVQSTRDSYVAVTYVPDTANVRQKMLIASTRLTLVRELGAEKFRETLFATMKQELSAEGWRKHEKHEQLKAPLTEEERTLQGVKEAEAEASVGTTSRNIHVGTRINFPVSDDALQALKDLNNSSSNNLVQLRIDVSQEAVELVSSSTVDVESIGNAISDSDPRLSFFRYSHEYGEETQSPVVFIYTCPTGSKVKERMVYATFTRSVVEMARSEAGVEVTKRLEASSPAEITAQTINEELHPKVEQKQAFSRPKRPGKR